MSKFFSFLVTLLYIIELILIVPFGIAAIIIIMGAILTFGSIVGIVYLFSRSIDKIRYLG